MAPQGQPDPTLRRLAGVISTGAASRPTDGPPLASGRGEDAPAAGGQPAAPKRGGGERHGRVPNSCRLGGLYRHQVLHQAPA